MDATSAGRRIRDIFLGTEALLTEVPGLVEDEIGDIIYGKVVQIDGVARLCGCPWVLIPPIFKQDVIELRANLRKSEHLENGAITALTLDVHDWDLRDLFLDIEKALTDALEENENEACETVVEDLETEREHPEALAILKIEVQKHWENWFHKKIPALGDRTPLEAAQDADGREMLEALLIHYQRGHTALTLPFPPDYSRLRQQLGLKSKPEGNR
ncbi:hypothetical protein WDW37_20430 [Bdellovibrionota bacterium FG-1]